MNTQANAEQTTTDLENISQFVMLRQQQVADIKHLNKNSLSNQIQLNKINTKSEKPNCQEKNKFTKDLLKNLEIALEEGHTIYSQKNIDKNQLDKLQQSNWLSILDDLQVNNLTKVNKPIVAYHHQDEWIFWLQRQWFAEKKLAEQILALAKQPLNNLADSLTITYEPKNDKKTANTLQQQAIEKACQFAFSIITGGPGTGKTFTVAKLVTQLQHAHDIKRKQQPNLPPLAIALTAPTGKAAQRMQESLNQSLGDNSLDNAKTLHRLLGIGQDGMPRYHANNPLPDDLVIVDEASMLGLELASQLVDAIKPNGRLVLLGDANQLSAVDAGAVLSDLCHVTALQPYHTELKESKRFDKNSTVGKIALAIQQAIAERIPAEIPTDLLKPTTPANFLKANLPTNKIPLFKPNSKEVYQVLAKPYLPFFQFIKDLKSIEKVEKMTMSLDDNRKHLFEIFNQYRILCAGHHGKLGTTSINQQIGKQLADFLGGIKKQQGFFYHGLPVMIISNDYHLGLFNGDIGICLLINDKLQVCFENKIVPVSRLSLSLCEPAFAMTIHKSQGSEFGCVAVCLDKTHERLLSQELIYTAVTRSKQDLMIVSDNAVLEKALSQKTLRNTGLMLQF